MPRKTFRTVLTAISPVFVIFAAAAASAPPRDGCAISRGGMVASACPLATAAGLRVLEDGGNAVDAAIAVGFALAVTYPQAGNIGGGGFMLIRTAGGEKTFIDFREKAPAGAHRDMYLDASGKVAGDLSVRGHLASGVPGSVAGLWKAHEMYGSLEWRRLLAPSIRLAGGGFPVSSHLRNALEKLSPKLESWPGLEKFYAESGALPEEGWLLVQPDLEKTLDRIAEGGPAGFYSGETARLLVEEMSRGGGLITEADLDSYETVVRDPVEGNYRGYGIVSAPPPSSGGVVLLEILNILEGFSFDGSRDAEMIHLVVEAERRAYSDRAVYLGDPDFVDMPVSNMISKEYASYLRKDIKAVATPSAELSGGKAVIESEETTHYSVMDERGNAVAVTTTLNGSFGAYVVVKGAGFLMNNEMDDFSIKPGVPNMYGLTGGEANAIEPGKRMLSSMTPTIVTDGDDPWVILGSPGGSTIITTVAQVLINMIDLGMDPFEAVSVPRYHHQWIPDVIYHEEGAFSAPEAEGLEEKGHVLKKRSAIGDVQLIMREKGRTTGVSDPRRGGQAMGTGLLKGEKR